MANALQQTFDQARSRYMALSVRERWVLLVGGVAVLATVIYLAVIEPVTLGHRRHVDALASSRALATQLENAAATVRGAAARSGGAAQVGKNMSLLAAVDQSTKVGSLGKAPERMQPEGDKEVKVWFDDVPFDNLVRWLAELQTRYGITVQTLDLEAQTGPGLVDARLSLTRPN